MQNRMIPPAPGVRRFLHALHVRQVRARAIAAYREYLAAEGMVMLSVDTLPAFRFNAPTLDRPNEASFDRLLASAGQCEDGRCLRCGEPMEDEARCGNCGRHSC